MAGMGEMIARRREQLGMLQDELAKRTRTSRRYISDVETGTKKHPVEPEVVNDIAEALEIPVAELLEADGYKILEKIDEAYRRRVIDGMTLAEFISLRYGIANTDFAPGLERVIRNAAETEKGSGKL